MEKNRRHEILNTAEQLFAQNGYDGVSIRDITSAADVRLASVNYYFGTKHALFWEILERRGGQVFSDRRSALNAIDFKNLSDREIIRQLVHASADPLLKRVLLGDKTWRAYVSLLTQYIARPLKDDEGPADLHKYDVVSLDYIKVLEKFLPEEEKRKAHHAFQFLISSTLMLFANNGRLNTLSASEFKSNEYEKIYQDGIDFIVGGMTALLLGD